MFCMALLRVEFESYQEERVTSTYSVAYVLRVRSEL